VGHPFREEPYYEELELLNAYEARIEQRNQEGMLDPEFAVRRELYEQSLDPKELRKRNKLLADERQRTGRKPRDKWFADWWKGYNKKLQRGRRERALEARAEAAMDQELERWQREREREARNMAAMDREGEQHAAARKAWLQAQQAQKKKKPRRKKPGR
jgi:hypothetical protein